MLGDLYEKYEHKSEICFFSAEQVMPLTHAEVDECTKGTADFEKLDKKMEHAIAIHYFWVSWLNTDNES